MQPVQLNFIETHLLHSVQKAAIYRLWNNEYPAQLAFTDMAHLDAYLDGLLQPTHFFVADDNGEIIGWAFTFVRDDAKWFAIIVDGNAQSKGVGSTLLRMLKRKENQLNGWMTDHDRYVKTNGEPYRSPASFYLKNGFIIIDSIRLETERLSAAKITWTKFK